MKGITFSTKCFFILASLLTGCFLSSGAAFAQCFSDGEIQILKITPPEGTVLEVGGTYTFQVDVSYKLTTSPPVLAWAGAFDAQTGINIPQSQNIISPRSRSGKTTLSLTAVITSYDGNPIDQVGIAAAISKDGDVCTYVYQDVLYFTDAFSPFDISPFPLNDPYNEDYITLGFCDPNPYYRNAIHKGVDIATPYQTSDVFAVCDGTVVFNNTNNTPDFVDYWNRVLVIEHHCGDKTVYGFYGHIVSVLQPGDPVFGHYNYQFPNPIGTIRVAYNESNVADPSNNHLHFGLNIKTSSHSNWGYASAGTKCSVINKQGWIDPRDFLMW